MGAPYWPRMMRLKTAAAYCDMTSADFTREIASGRLPFPIAMEGGDRWDREAIDQALNLMRGDADDWRKGCPGLAA